MYQFETPYSGLTVCLRDAQGEQFAEASFRNGRYVTADAACGEALLRALPGLLEYHVVCTVRPQPAPPPAVATETPAPAKRRAAKRKDPKHD